MLNKDLLLCSKGEDVPVKYEYTVDGLSPSMGIGGIQPGFRENENVKTPYWGGGMKAITLSHCSLLLMVIIAIVLLK